MNRLSLPSPAKLNLFLKIQNKRLDGYHNIVTVFERIDLADTLTFRPTRDSSVRITCDHLQVPLGPDNLVHKVASLLKQEFNIPSGVQIDIRKKIPVAAGLAGGSSNAATALLGLNRLWKLGLSKHEMLALAREIGSDVAFFLHDTSWALGTGRGDRIKKLDIPARLWHVLVVPRVKIYSGQVYQGLKWPIASAQGPTGQARKNSQGVGTNLLTKIYDDANILIRNLKKDKVLEAGLRLSNDLERQIFKIHPPLLKLKERLKSLNTQGVMVSGSGPCVFTLMATHAEAESLKKLLARRFSRVFVARTL